MKSTINLFIISFKYYFILLNHFYQYIYKIIRQLKKKRGTNFPNIQNYQEKYFKYQWYLEHYHRWKSSIPSFSLEKWMQAHQIAYDHALKSWTESNFVAALERSQTLVPEQASFVPIDMRRAYNKLFVQTTFPLVETLPPTGGDFHFTFQPLPFLRIFVATRTKRGRSADVFAPSRE